LLIVEFYSRIMCKQEWLEGTIEFLLELERIRSNLRNFCRKLCNIQKAKCPPISQLVSSFPLTASYSSVVSSIGYGPERGRSEARQSSISPRLRSGRGERGEGELFNVQPSMKIVEGRKTTKEKGKPELGTREYERQKKRARTRAYSIYIPARGAF